MQVNILQTYNLIKTNMQTNLTCCPEELLFVFTKRLVLGIFFHELLHCNLA